MNFQSLSENEKEQLRSIDFILKDVQRMSKKDLIELIDSQINLVQPYIGITTRMLYMQYRIGKHTVSLMRIIVWIWRYYLTLMPVSESLIVQDLYWKMREKNQVWNSASSEEITEEEAMRIFGCKDHPSGPMVKKLYDLLFSEPFGSLKKLPVIDRLYLADIFCFLLDCYEELRLVPQN